MGVKEKYKTIMRLISDIFNQYLQDNTMCVRIPSILYCMERDERGTQMPQVRKLAPEEIQTIQDKGKGTRKLVEEQYDSILSDYAIGEYGEAALDADEKRLTVRNRLKAAAGRHSLGINFRRTNGDFIRFQIVDPSDVKVVTRAKPVQRIPEPDPEPEPVTPPKRKGGRPKKNS